MDRIAIISDIHGNMTAFRAVLDDIAARGISHIVNLGDIAGKGPDGAAAIDLSREVCAVHVRGNWDEFITGDVIIGGVETLRAELGPERCAWLGTLPFAHDFVFGGKRVRLLHASPQGVGHRVTQRGDDEPKLAMFENTEYTDPEFTPGVVGYGDIHTAYMRSFHNRVLFNVGSVGNPLDMTMATYAIMESSGLTLGVSIVRVPYDIEAELRRAKASGMSGYDEYAFELTTGRYRREMPVAAMVSE